MLQAEPNLPSILRARSLIEARVAADGFWVLYRLLSAGESFLVEVTLESETVLLAVGRDKDMAVLLYQRLVRGSVTPCTAEDIWEDLCIECG